MSTANGAIEKIDTYLQRVSLKNYKSIKDVEIDFKPGLNIIIGKNASGKTNFINGLNNALNLKHRELQNSESKIDISKNGKTITLGSHLTPENGNYRRLFNFDGDKEKFESKDYVEYQRQLVATKNGYRSNLITYGTPYNDDTEFLQRPSSIVISSNGALIIENLLNFDDSHTEFIKQYFSKLFSDLVFQVRNRCPIDKNYIESKIKNSDRIFKFLNSTLKFYSPISEIKINPDFRVGTNTFNNNEIILMNFSFQFKVSGIWQPFNFLSDGTKRLFYIISEIVGLNHRHEKPKPEGSNFDIIFIEEPELGIHPHQLHQLMQLIKERASEKQIIITTHSPQVLDVLGPDELDRIIICHSDTQKGTQLSHLTAKEVKKAKMYMKNAFLSDYWRFSDLEPVS